MKIGKLHGLIGKRYADMWK